MTVKLFHVGIVTPRYPPAIGGVEQHVAVLARTLTSIGVQVDVITTDPSGQLPAEEWCDGILVRRFPTIANNDVFFLSPQLGAWLARELGRFDLLHAHSYHTPLAFQAAMAARRYQIPLVVTPHYHGGGHTLFRHLLHIPYRAIGSWMIHQADMIICVSKVERDLVHSHFGPRPITVIPNGVDLAVMDAPPALVANGRTLVLTVGRLEGYKRVDRLIAAVPLLPPTYDFAIVGDGPMRTVLEQQVVQLGITERVHFFGHVTQSVLHGLYRAARVFVSLSEHEAFGITVVEAIVGGATVVVSDIPAHRELASYTGPDALRFVSPTTGTVELAAIVAVAGQVIQDVRPVALPTWERMGQEVFAQYEMLLKRRFPHVQEVMV